MRFACLRDEVDDLRDRLIAVRLSVAGQIPMIRIERLIAGVQEVAACGLAEAKVEEPGMQRIDDGAHDIVVIPPCAGDEVHSVLKAPGGKDGEQGIEAALLCELFVGGGLGFHVGQDRAKRLHRLWRFMGGGFVYGACEVGEGSLAASAAVMGAAPVVQLEGWAEAFECSNGLIGRERVQLHGVRGPDRYGLQACSRVFRACACGHDPLLIGSAPVIRVEEQPVDRGLGAPPQVRAVLRLDVS